MLGFLLCPCRYVRDICKGLTFNWNRRRFSWRASLYYNWVSGILALGMVCNVTLFLLIQGHWFFTNYQCSSRSFGFFKDNIMSMMVMTGVMMLISFVLARLTSMFSNYSLSDFMSTGKWADRLGCMVKWLPWLAAIFLLAIMLLNIINIITVYAFPVLWCSSRWLLPYIQSVRNCRMVHTGNCKVDDMKPSEITHCNEFGFLQRKHYLWFADKSDVASGSCTFEESDICSAFNANSNSAIAGDIANRCAGSSSVSREAATDPAVVSDLYRYGQMYILMWIVGFVTMILFGVLIRSITAFDAIFYQAPQEGDACWKRTLRPLTPWIR